MSREDDTRPDPADESDRPLTDDENDDTETDVQSDDAVAGSRATGGVPKKGVPDPHSTTGTTPKDVYVGRISGDDSGYEGETGAEVREKNERR